MAKRPPTLATQVQSLRQAVNDLKSQAPPFRVTVTQFFASVFGIMRQPFVRTAWRELVSSTNELFWCFATPERAAAIIMATAALGISFYGRQIAKQHELREERREIREKQRDVAKELQDVQTEIRTVLDDSLNSRMTMLAGQMGGDHLQGLIDLMLDATSVDMPAPSLANVERRGGPAANVELPAGASEVSYDIANYDLVDLQPNLAYLWQGQYVQSELQASRIISLIDHLELVYDNLEQLKKRELELSASPGSEDSYSFSAHDKELLLRERVMYRFNLAVLLAQNAALRNAAELARRAKEDLNTLRESVSGGAEAELLSKSGVQVDLVLAITSCLAETNFFVEDEPKINSSDKARLFDRIEEAVMQADNGLLAVQKQLLLTPVLAVKVEALTADLLRPHELGDPISKADATRAIEELVEHSAVFDQLPSSGFANIIEINRSVARSVVENARLRLAFYDLRGDVNRLDGFALSAARNRVTQLRFDRGERNRHADFIVGLSLLQRAKDEWASRKLMESRRSWALSEQILGNYEARLPQIIRSLRDDIRDKLDPNERAVRQSAPVPTAPTP